MPSKLTAVKTADIIHKNSGRSFLAVFLDIARSYFEYGSSFENYLDFNFEASESGKRREYVTKQINTNYIRRNNKIRTLNRKDFLEKYSPGFDYAFTLNCDDFLSKHESFIALSLDGSVKALINQDSYVSKESLLNDLKER